MPVMNRYDQVGFVLPTLKDRKHRAHGFRFYFYMIYQYAKCLYSGCYCSALIAMDKKNPPKRIISLSIIFLDGLSGRHCRIIVYFFEEHHITA